MASLISVGQILDQSLEHCRKHYKELLAIVLWIVVASIPFVIGKLLSPTGGDATLTGGDWVTFAISASGAVLVAVVSLWMYAALTLTVADQAAGKRVNLKALSEQGWKAFWKYLLLTVTLSLIFLGFALIIAPGYALLLIGSISNKADTLSAIGTPLFFLGAITTMYLLIKYTVQLAFAPYLLLLEKKSVIESIKQSAALVQGRWWATCVRFVIPKALVLLAFLIINYVVFTAIQIFIVLVEGSSSTLALMIFALSLFLSVFLSAIVTPIMIVTDYYLYDSLRKTR